MSVQRATDKKAGLSDICTHAQFDRRCLPLTTTVLRVIVIHMQGEKDLCAEPRSQNRL